MTRRTGKWIEKIMKTLHNNETIKGLLDSEKWSLKNCNLDNVWWSDLQVAVMIVTTSNSTLQAGKHSY